MIGNTLLTHPLFFVYLKTKITTAKSLGDIAMDLTDSGVPKSSKMVGMDSKDQLIMASNGSLVSAGNHHKMSI